ncbi:hypothetical protein HMPREF9005_0497 [Actinomyces sp. oral taxon 178 str. F0338]|nr:hypothetical protein HMPREF9005_0497 [Actinomyces sp. oral taxon 178 str. F0338]
MLTHGAIVAPRTRSWSGGGSSTDPRTPLAPSTGPASHVERRCGAGPPWSHGQTTPPPRARPARAPLPLPPGVHFRTRHRGRHRLGRGGAHRRRSVEGGRRVP